MIRTNAIAVAILAAVMGAPAMAQEGCLISEAADAALDRQISAIEATQTDVASFFTGPNSCINQDLLQMIDFSVDMPDPANLLRTLQTGMYDQLLSQAQQKFCDVMNEQIDGAVGNLDATMVNWESGLSDEIRGIITDG